MTGPHLDRIALLGLEGPEARITGRQALALLALLRPGRRELARDRIPLTAEASSAVWALERAVELHAEWLATSAGTSANGSSAVRADLGLSHSQGRLLSAAEAAALLGVGERNVRDLARRGRLAGSKAGGVWTFDERTVVAEARKRRGGP